LKKQEKELKDKNFTRLIDKLILKLWIIGVGLVKFYLNFCEGSNAYRKNQNLRIGKLNLLKK
jgi:beta-lactamase regulating signal transducer with metallopeptidase domain